MDALQDKILHGGSHEVASALQTRVADLEGYVGDLKANAWFEGNRLSELRSQNEKLDAEVTVYTTLLTGERNGLSRPVC
jgi:hypothetical protein